METTRKYHRNSVFAFPKTTEYACAVEKYVPDTDKVGKYTLYFCIAGFIVMCVTQFVKGF